MPARTYSAGHAFPVSVKGVAVQDGKVLLLENERNEWELPGGKLELGEDPADCVVREISEETGCHVLSTDPPAVSNEHKQAALFTPGQISELVMPDGYKRSVAAWVAQPAPAPGKSVRFHAR